MIDVLSELHFCLLLFLSNKQYISMFKVVVAAVVIFGTPDIL